jgi:hypothetical protein
MRVIRMMMIASALALAAGCGGNDEPEPEEEVMKVEDTAVGDLVTTPARVQDRTDAAIDKHRDALESRIEADEGAPPDEEDPAGD